MRTSGVERLDTSAYSHFKRGDPAVVDLIDRADWLGLPSIALGELWIGFLLGNRMERNQAELNEFLSHPQVVELVPDAEVARIYAEMVVSLQKAGTPIPSNDVWIAATAKRAGVPVLTYDDHFLDIQQVNTLLLPTPPGKRQI